MTKAEAKRAPVAFESILIFWLMRMEKLRVKV